MPNSQAQHNRTTKGRCTIKLYTQEGEKSSEMPFRVLALMDASGESPKRKPLSERTAIRITKEGVTDVMRSLEPTCTVETKSGKRIPLVFREMKDFDPENIVMQVPHLKAKLGLLDHLRGLRNEIDNSPAAQKTIQSILANETIQSLLKRDPEARAQVERFLAQMAQDKTTDS